MYSYSSSNPGYAPAAQRARPRATALALILSFSSIGCASALPEGVPASPGRVVPLVDYHQHLMSERMISPPPASAPLVELPPELAAALEARNQVIATGEAGDPYAGAADLYTGDARILNTFEGGWMQGEEGVSEIKRVYSKAARFFANGYSLGDSVAAITGVIRAGDYTNDALNFTMALERDAAGRWRISSEGASVLPPRQLASAVTADDLIYDLDAVGIRKAVVLSVAYWFGDPDSDQPDEYGSVRAENDWTAAEAARYPDRLVAFCGISPLRDYAETEIRRCAGELGVPGIKMHFQNDMVNLHDPTHVARVRRVFELANELGLAIVVHSRTSGDFGADDRAEAEIILHEILPAAPDVTVQIAHMWGGNQVSEGALAVFADAVSANDPRARNLYFDLTHVETAANTPEKLELIARYARQIGMDRLLYGSDMAVMDDEPPSTLGWNNIVNEIPLTRAEFADIADNVAPYLR